MKIRMQLQTEISPHCETRTNMNPKFKTGPGLSNLWGNSIVVRDHPYITSAKGQGGWVSKLASFADVQYCIYAGKVGGVQKGQK